MAVRFTCIKCQKKNFSQLPVCEHCKAMQNIPIRIPQGATEEQIKEYLKKLKEAKKSSEQSSKQD